MTITQRLKLVRKRLLIFVKQTITKLMSNANYMLISALPSHKEIGNGHSIMQNVPLSITYFSAVSIKGASFLKMEEVNV